MSFTIETRERTVQQDIRICRCDRCDHVIAEMWDAYHLPDGTFVVRQAPIRLDVDENLHFCGMWCLYQWLENTMTTHAEGRGRHEG